MKGDSSINRIRLLSQSALLIVIFLLTATSTFGYRPSQYTTDEASGNSTGGGEYYVVAKDDGLSYGMSKAEAYEVKGLPDKTNRISGEEGKEMWVYRCENDEGFNEDCLYLYFDGDKLVKIDRL